jgi:hypothetical protein
MKTAIRLIAVHLGLASSVALGEGPVAGREDHPRTRSRLARWVAVLTLAVALLPGAASAQEDDTVTISGTFYMDWLDGTVGPDLAEVFANGHEHTWTLTLHGTTHSHSTYSTWFGYIRRATEIHATSFDLEFFGPDAAALNGIVSEHIAGGDVSVYLENAYSSGSGDDFAVWDVSVFGPDVEFRAEELGWGWNPLFPSDPDGYPVVGPDPLTIYAEYNILIDNRPGNDGSMWSEDSLVTFEGSVGDPHPVEPVVIAVADASVLEGDRGFSTVAVAVTLSRASSQAITLS